MPKTPRPVIHAETRVPPSALKEFPGNTNKHPKRNREAIKAALDGNGQLEALVVWGKDTLSGQQKDEVLGGNGRLIVIRDDLAWPDILIRRVDCTPKQAKAINIGLNRVGRLSERDDELEAEALKDLRDEPLLLEAAGYTDDEVDDLLASLDAADEPDPETLVETPAPALPAEPKTKAGDVWILGKHRLVCGDSTNRDVVRVAFNGQGADAVFTDPPYGIAYQDVKKKHRKIAGDDVDPLVLTQKALEASGLQPDLPVYVCCDWRSLGSIRAAVKNAGHQEKAVIVWDKERPAQNLDRYFKAHEFILYAGPYGGEKTLRGDVWHVGRLPSTLHPTQKPVELVGFAVRDATSRGGLVYDPFAGSGSTLLACEQLGRRAVCVELDPAYCDVVVQRWEELTGKTATRAGAST